MDIPVPLLAHIASRCPAPGPLFGTSRAGRDALDYLLHDEKMSAQYLDQKAISLGKVNTINFDTDDDYQHVDYIMRHPLIERIGWSARFRVMQSICKLDLVLLWASKYGRADVIEQMLALGVDVDIHAHYDEALVQGIAKRFH